MEELLSPSSQLRHKSRQAKATEDSVAGSVGDTVLGAKRGLDV